MGQRKRMFNDTVLCGGKFLMLSTEAKLLYIYLQLFADDDGIVDANTVLHYLGRDFEAHIAELESADFLLVVLEEELIYHCTWFRYQNTINPRYKVDSMYLAQFQSRYPDIARIKNAPKKKRAGNKMEADSSLESNKKDNEKKYCSVPADTWARFDR